ncbi:hypothetical protein XENOCAPTIV_023513, partial [Xenoophorus captivus]
FLLGVEMCGISFLSLSFLPSFLPPSGPAFFQYLSSLLASFLSLPFPSFPVLPSYYLTSLPCVLPLSILLASFVLSFLPPFLSGRL